MLGRPPGLLMVMLGGWCCMAAAVRFRAFDSTPFDFRGAHGSAYNLLSEQNHQLNVRMASAAATDVEAGDEVRGETLIRELVFKYRDDAVHVATDGSGRLAVSADKGALIWERTLSNEGAKSSSGISSSSGGSSGIGSNRVKTALLPSGMRLLLWRSVFDATPSAAPQQRGTVAGTPQAANRLVLATPDMTVEVRLPWPQQAQQQQQQQGQQQLRQEQHQQQEQPHLDVRVVSVSPYLCDVHGILGQTYKRQYGVTPGPFTAEGAEFDYELPSLRSDAFQFNRFRSGRGSGCGAAADAAADAAVVEVRADGVAAK